MRVVVAMSGGVDSTVAALRLKDEGHEIIGMTIKTWPGDECGRAPERACCSLDSVQYARTASEDMGIPHYVVDLSDEFISEVRGYFESEYSRGRTPNPCIVCNTAVKFGCLMKKTREIGACALATGHYARIEEVDGSFALKEAVDKTKDQSYFLCGIQKKELENIFFPLGGIKKTEVRSIASKFGFMSAYRSSSQDICFTEPGSDYRGYLNKKNSKGFVAGDLRDTSGNIIGRHRGVAAYTLGQRKGLGLGLHFPLYVVDIDHASNTITVGSRQEIMKRRIKVRIFNWLLNEGPDVRKDYDIRIRYGGNRSSAVFTPADRNEGMLEFTERQFAPTPGQAAVFYDGEMVAGGAWIEGVLD